MAIDSASKPRYRLIGLPGFEDVWFTEDSSDWLTLPEAVKFAAEQDGVLQSAREAAAFRIGFARVSNSNRRQATRTVAAYFTQDGKSFVAFDDSPEVSENPILSRAEEGCKSYNETDKFIVPKEQVAALLERAKIDDRIVQLESGEGAALSKAILGDIAQPYSSHLGKQGYVRDYNYILTDETLKDLGVTDKKVELRAVGLGGDDFSVGDLVAIYPFNDVGYSRGVVQPAKFFNGNKSVLAAEV